MSMPAERVIKLLEKVIWLNGSYRRAVLDAYIFRTLQDVRDLTEAWMTDYLEAYLRRTTGTNNTKTSTNQSNYRLS